jgi:Zinc carboxypeptidase
MVRPRNNSQANNLIGVIILQALILLLNPHGSFSQVVPYTLLSAEQVASTIQSWQTEYPEFVVTRTSQDVFGLPTAGDSSDCPFDASVDGCLNYYAVLQDYASHPEGSATSNRLPTMLLSGELHGDERVGPTSVMEAARILLEAAACEALPRYTADDAQWETQFTQFTTCRQALKERYGMGDTQRQWLARLMTTRRILLVPTANALGYYRDTREEGDIDPNRDFPYDQLPEDAALCMQSIAARTLNELFRHYLISNSFTFHGGTELLGYEWGNPSHFGSLSPDDVAQDQLARSYSVYGGSFRGEDGEDHPDYMYGDMNSIIYYVRGGFEDYAYAGSWDTDRMVVCQPNTFGGYSADKTMYEDGMLRTFNMLVEASWSKTPNEDDLGTSLNVLYQNSDVASSKRRMLRRGDNRLVQERNAQGHIPRNMRLSIAAIDMIHPYLRTVAINGLKFPDDVVPLTPRGFSEAPACTNRALVLDTTQQVLEQALDTGALPVIEVPLSGGVTLDWTVGGAMTIDETQLWVAVLGDSAVAALDGTSWLQNYICGDPADESISLFQRLDPAIIQSAFTAVGTAQTGTGFFSAYGSQPVPTDDTMGPIFSATLDLTSLAISAPTTLLVLASAKVDSSWTQLPLNEPVAPTGAGPQSHMVHARTNASWKHVNSQGYVVEGRTAFFSTPILVRLVDDISISSTTLVNNRLQKPSDRSGLTATTTTASLVEQNKTSAVNVSVTIAQSFEPTLAPSEATLPNVMQRQSKPEPESHQSMADVRKDADKLIHGPKDNPDGGQRRRQQRQVSQRQAARRGRSRAVKGQQQLVKRP